MNTPKWLKLAQAELGTKEIPGTADSPAVLHYAQEAGVGSVVSHDSVPWCAAFVGAMLARAGMHGTGKANAKSYLDWGEKLNGPVLGCVVVLNRPPNDWEGHVAFYVGRASVGAIRLLGGNQADMVCEADFDLGRVAEYRWPLNTPIEASQVGHIWVKGPATSNPSDR